MRAATDDPLMAGFVRRLEPLNALAEASPGFVWQLQDDEEEATAARLFGGERILFNMSVWESIEALEAYTYRSAHVEAVRRRGEWFERASKPGVVLWWLPAGHLPSVVEARRRFERLWEHGPGPDAFTFGNRFEVPA
jgi:hypothetical protein